MPGEVSEAEATQRALPAPAAHAVGKPEQSFLDVRSEDRNSESKKSE